VTGLAGSPPMQKAVARRCSSRSVRSSLKSHSFCRLGAITISCLPNFLASNENAPGPSNINASAMLPESRTSRNRSGSAFGATQTVSAAMPRQNSSAANRVFTPAARARLVRLTNTPNTRNPSRTKRAFIAYGQLWRSAVKARTKRSSRSANPAELPG